MGATARLLLSWALLTFLEDFANQSFQRRQQARSALPQQRQKFPHKAKLLRGIDLAISASPGIRPGIKEVHKAAPTGAHRTGLIRLGGR